MFYQICIFLVLLCSLSLTHTASQLSYKVDEKTGDYTVYNNQETWLKGGSYSCISNGKLLSSSDGSLKLTSSKSVKGIDASIGSYTGTQLQFSTSSGDVIFVATFRSYSLLSGNLITFTQEFPMGLKNTSLGDSNKVITTFPSFAPDPNSAYITWSGNQIQDAKVGKMGDKGLPNGVSNGGPIAIFNEDLQTTVMSSFDNFMVGSFQLDSNGYINYGLLGSITEVPPNFSYSVVLVAGAVDGVRNGFSDWGAVMSIYYRRAFKQDFTVDYLSYYTDNGAFYYYHTESGKNYQDTLLDVKKYADENSIPYRYFQLDSWWYFKGSENGVKNWTAMPTIFPNGLEDFRDKLGLPFVAHNRYWSANTDYAKQNGGQFDFIVEKELSIPLKQNFWNYLFQESAKWGLVTYEQDWLDKEFPEVKATVEDVNIARNWLIEMGKGAEQNGVTIQYCMMYPRHTLQALEVPAISHARASDDYHPSNMQWHIGDSSLFLYNVQLIPFKDNFWTTKTQPDNPYNLEEAYPELESVVATLSSGPVGISDKIGYSNKTLIMKSCNADGLLLKASTPAVSIDATFAHRAFGKGADGQVWSSQSRLGFYAWYHVFAAEMKSDYKFTPLDVNQDPTFTYFSYKGDPKNIGLTAFNTNASLDLVASGRGQFELYHLAPVLNDGSLFLGELEKWIPVSTKRFSALDSRSDGFSIKMGGASGEVVTFYVADSNTLKVNQFSCTIPDSTDIVFDYVGGSNGKCIEI